MNKKILIILGHPDKETLCGALADEYARGAKSAGAEVRRINLGDLKFDPILWKGYKVIQKLEPDLARAQKDIQWAEHLVFVFPDWWGTMPALMKGFFDRALLPGFGFYFKKGARKQECLLKGRTARLIVTTGAKIMLYRIFERAAEDTMQGVILSFCGIKPTRTTVFGPAENVPKDKLKKWFARARYLGKKMK